ncbi:hypothetical protein PR202_gb01513 [Eleusine coracana subsp. coracana]|uniref:DUF1618 domain-containing protein n=1 Tax=Eleusine coracana subsp. coracana TaxID=191504 RepID=A0AAV5DWB4_ELECO|nr:hypothetical protein PR202_gb01513 [Eleusine coracana subsp. coracana]
MTLRRLLGLSSAVSGHLRRGFSTAASSRPPWAMMYVSPEVMKDSRDPRVSLYLVEAPDISELFVPDHLVRDVPDPGSDEISLGVRGFIKASSGGLLLLNFLDLRGTAPVVPTPGGGGGGTTLKRKLLGVRLEPDVSRFVCNPLGGQMFRLPDIDGKKKSLTCAGLGILTQSERPDGPPDRYVVAELSAPDDGAEDWRFFLRRFDSGTGKGEWDKPVALPSPLPLVRRMDIDREVIAFAGRLWYVDVSWGAVSVDPFSDQPDLRFIELPRGSVTEPPKGPMEPDLDGYRRMGISEGRLRYAEVSQKEPFSLSYFALEDDGVTWNLEHRVELSRLLPHEDLDAAEETPRMGVLDPMNASVIHITLGDQIFSVDMDNKMVLGCVRTSLTLKSALSAHLKSCVLPPWLESSQIPSAVEVEHSATASFPPRCLRSAAAISSSLRRGISTAASRPAWAMIHPLARLTKSPEPRAFLRFAEPPCASHHIVPAHLAEHPATDPYGDDVCLIYGVLVKATSGDGLVLLSFMDIRATAPIVSTHGDVPRLSFVQSLESTVHSIRLRLPICTRAELGLGFEAGRWRPDIAADEARRRLRRRPAQAPATASNPITAHHARPPVSSFALDDDGSCWTLEHRVALSRIFPQGNYLSGKDSPRVGFVDPLNASLMHLTVNKQVFSVDMDGRKVLSCSMRAKGAGLSCLLPP